MFDLFCFNILAFCKKKTFNNFSFFFRFDFVSTTNEAIVVFHSDWSRVAGGFVAKWRAVNIRGCPNQELRNSHSTISSPNFPHFNLPGLHCTSIIKAPGKLSYNKIKHEL